LASAVDITDEATKNTSKITLIPSQLYLRTADANIKLSVKISNVSDSTDANKHPSSNHEMLKAYYQFWRETNIKKMFIMNIKTLKVLKAMKIK
jgi:hypothetical protein